MGLEDFQTAFDALPENLERRDVIDFLAAVAISYMPPTDAIRSLIVASTRIAEFAAERGLPMEGMTNECTCPKCLAERANFH